MDSVFQDLRYAVRMLRKRPGFTLVVALTLALGIGANTTIFSTMNAVVFQPFSFKNQDRLVMLWERNPEIGYARGSVAPGNFNDWREQHQTFDQIIAISQSYFDITEGDQPERYNGYMVSATFFDAFGVQPLLGRTFSPEEGRTGQNQVVVLKHSLWQNRFGADPDIVGKPIAINGSSFTCIGVMGPDFNFPFNGGEMWTPMVFDVKDLTNRNNHYLQVLGVLKAGVTIEQASEDLNRIAQRTADCGQKQAFCQQLANQSKTPRAHRQSNRARSMLVVSEIALSLVLLIGAGLMIRSFVQILRSDLGVNPTSVLTMQVSLTGEKYAPVEQRMNFYRQLLDRVSALPGVLNAGTTSNLPMGGSHNSTFMISAGQTLFPQSRQPDVNYRSVAPGYFAAIGTRISKGRNFTEADRTDGPRIALVNEAFASRFFADQEPVGQQFKIDNGKPLEIVGVVANVMNDDMDNITEPDMYVPYTQNARQSMALIIRTSADPNHIASAVRSEVSAIDKTLPVFNIKAMQQVINERLSPKRLATLLIGCFGLIALLLASVGIYAVMSYAVSQRTHEIGIRMALGARPQDIFKLIVGHGLFLTAIGLAVGLFGAFAMTRAMSRILYGVTATDPLTFIGISLLLAAVALCACYIPARRATKVDPGVALRYE